MIEYSTERRTVEQDVMVMSRKCTLCGKVSETFPLTDSTSKPNGWITIQVIGESLNAYGESYKEQLSRLIIDGTRKSWDICSFDCFKELTARVISGTLDPTRVP